MLFSVLPAAAGQSISSDTTVQLAAGAASTTDRNTYTQKARDAMYEWQQKLHDFSEKAKAKGREEGNAADNELNAALTKAEAEQHKLESASAEDWESAKISFEKASHDLKEVWDKIRPDDK
jgi:L-lactate utilization protein LutC